MAVKSKATILSEIAANVDTNGAGGVTAADVRTRMEDMTDSMFPSKTWFGGQLSNHANPPVSAFGTFDTVRDLGVLDLDGVATDESIVVVGLIPEGAVVSSGCKVRVLLSPDAGTTGNIRLRARVDKIAGETASFGAWTTITLAVSNATDYVVGEITIASGDLDGAVAGDFIAVEIGRNASDTTNDTMADDAQLLAYEVRSAA